MTLMDWCRCASAPARQVLAAGARGTSVLREWERFFFRGLMRAVEDSQSPGSVPERTEAAQEGLDRSALCIPKVEGDERVCKVADEACRPTRVALDTSVRPPGVLIADDEEAICFSLARELRRQGITTYVAADGARALKLFQEHGNRIDVVFLDVRMPGLDGPKALAAMRRIAPALPCCFMTAFGIAALDDEKDASVEVLKKPFDLNVFLRVLYRLLGVQATDSLRAG